MSMPRIQTFAHDVGQTILKALRGRSEVAAQRRRLCARELLRRAQTIDDRELLFCDFELAMHFRVAYGTLMRVTEDRAGDRNFHVDARVMMERFFPEARQVLDGLVLRPLHNSFQLMSGIIHGTKDTLLLSAQQRVLKQIERGTLPAPQTLDRWSLLGMRYLNRLTEVAFQKEWLKLLDKDSSPKLQTQGMMTEALRGALLISDLRRAQLIYNPQSASELVNW